MPPPEQMKRLISITGPTAAGKSAYAIHLARRLGAPVVSADSVQVYRGLDIGSGKVRAEEMAGVPHYMIDILAPCAHFDAGAYERRADALLAELFERYDDVLLAGGSGFYFQAVWEGFDEMPEVDAEVRAALARELEANGLEKLVAELKAADPETWARIDRRNPARVLRALGVYRASGTPISAFRKRKAEKAKAYAELRLGLTMPREALYARIEQRVDVMLAAGWLAETRALWMRYGRDCKGLRSLGYRELVTFLEGECAWEETVRLIKRNTRRYAKRQLTWFRRYESVRWFRFDDYAGMDGYAGLNAEA